MIIQHTKRLWSTGSHPGGARRVPGVAVVEVIGEIRELERLGVAEEGLVVPE
ncbi:hypothetical protein [Methanoculleus bourgensis]|uniref:hypothetical protein n=1 Tax=Methanoculleus bourgensis TaxID=83986 RepID=UPI00248F5169|nr:hypothetical protein [Methanoculleus bourgensis]